MIYRIVIIYHNPIDETFYTMFANKQHIKKFGRINVPSMKHKSGSCTVKRYLLFENIERKFISNLIALFRSDVKYWENHFTEFNENNYPEYFI